MIISLSPSFPKRRPFRAQLPLPFQTPRLGRSCPSGAASGPAPGLRPSAQPQPPVERWLLGAEPRSVPDEHQPEGELGLAGCAPRGPPRPRPAEGAGEGAGGSPDAPTAVHERVLMLCVCGVEMDTLDAGRCIRDAIFIFSNVY